MKRTMVRHTYLPILGAALLFANAAVAQTPEATPAATATPAPAKVEKLKPGVVASFGTARRQTSVNTAGDPTPGGEGSPIQASVSRKGTDECIAKVINPSEKDSYSASFEIVGTDDNGNKAVRKSFSASLPPKATVERSVRCRPGLNMSVVLTSGKKTSK